MDNEEDEYEGGDSEGNDSGVERDIDTRQTRSGDDRPDVETRRDFFRLQENFSIPCFKLGIVGLSKWMISPNEMGLGQIIMSEIVGGTKQKLKMSNWRNELCLKPS